MMPGGFAALLIMFGVPWDQVNVILEKRGTEPAPFSERSAILYARRIAQEEGYLND